MSDGKLKETIKADYFSTLPIIYYAVFYEKAHSNHDNYATYGLCQKWGIRPFIDLNSNRGRPDSIPDTVSIDSDGTPLCMAGFRMVNWGTAGRSIPAYLLNEIPKHEDDTNRDFLDDLLPWSPNLPERCRKSNKYEVK